MSPVTRRAMAVQSGAGSTPALGCKARRGVQAKQTTRSVCGRPTPLGMAWSMTPAQWSRVVRRLHEEASKWFAESYTATALVGIADDTQDSYLEELRKFATFAKMRPGESNREALSVYMLHLVCTTGSDGDFKKVLAGVRFLEKLGRLGTRQCRRKVPRTTGYANSKGMGHDGDFPGAIRGGLQAGGMGVRCVVSTVHGMRIAGEGGLRGTL